MKFSGRIKNFSSNFELLELSLSEDEANKYYSDWIKKYKAYFKVDCEERTIIMANRSLRARREIISSAILLEEARISHDNGCISATYFLTYYSLFHAMWSVIFLNTDLKNSVSEISHQRLMNLFCDYYTRNNFFDMNMKTYILNMKDMREFFSYNVPFNMIGDSIDFDLVELTVLKCFQLANLHNAMLVECTNLVKISEENIYSISEYFELFNGRTKDNGEIVRDPSEQNQLMEMFKYGVAINNFELEIGHDWDEMGYSEYLTDKFDKQAVYKIKGKAIELVYKAIEFV